MNIFCDSAKKLTESYACLLEFANLWQLNVEESWWKSSFGYCPLVWICCDRSRNNRIIYLHERALSRSSHQRCSLKKGVLRNFAKLTGKFLCQSLFFNKVAGLRPATLLKKRLRHKCFPVNFVKFLRTPFFVEHL